jgi:2'-5' RNA ligase
VRVDPGIRRVVLAGLRLCCLVAIAALSNAAFAAGPAEGAKIIAINVLLEPDATMATRARALNARLRENYPRGYALDATHVPHITLVQRFVRDSDADAIAAAVSQVIGPTGPSLHLTAVGLSASEWIGLGVLSINVDGSPELRHLEQRIVDAVQPYAVSGGTADAFFVRATEEPVNQRTVEYVEKFVPAASGEKFTPHVTVGVAEVPFVTTLKSEPFENFSFSTNTIAIYQLGNFGTARKKLWSAPPRSGAAAN